MPDYARHLTHPPQSEPAFGREQVKNDAGGYVFEIDPFDALDRFLILGCETGTYYANESKMTHRAASIVLKCANLDPQRTVSAIVAASARGKAIKNDPAIFALALLAGQAGNEMSKRALWALNDVCRIGTHLFNFVGQVTQFRGWGRGLRKAVAGWYTSKEPRDLAYQVTKYQQRNGWSHRDLLRLSHPVSEKLNPLFKYIALGTGCNALFDEMVKPFVLTDPKKTLDMDTFEYLRAIEAVKITETEDWVVERIQKFGLVREHIPTKWLNSPRVWEALLERMPFTALIRNLGKMTNIGLISPLSDATKLVCEKLSDDIPRVHPFSILLAQTTYAAGCGVRGRLTWTPNQLVVNALEDAFYHSFESVVPAGKNFMLGIDVSGSMGWRGFDYMGSIAGTHIKAYQAAAVMAMAQIKTEPWCYPAAFSGRGKLTPLSLSRKQSLDTVLADAEDSGWSD